MLQPSIDPTNTIVHRFTRGAARIDVSVHEEVVDVLTADHAAPSQVERLRGYDLMRIEGGTQALRRTINATLHIDGQPLTVSVPNPYGALILKSAAHLTDSRDKQRHLSDAVALLASIEDPFAVVDEPAFGSDAKRLRHLAEHLNDPGELAWMALDAERRSEARAALQILLDRLDPH